MGMGGLGTQCRALLYIHMMHYLSSNHTKGCFTHKPRVVRDHEMVRAQMKVSESRLKIPSKLCIVVTDSQV